MHHAFTSASLRTTLAALTFVGFSACGRGSSGEAGRVPALLQVASGDVQQGVVGAELGAPVAVRVVDAAGAPVAGQIVNFRITLGGGSVFAGVAISSPLGIAAERWVLGPTAGPQRLEARAIDSGTGAALSFATFTATAAPDVPASITAAAGSLQAAEQLTALPVALRAHVADRFGNPVPGVEVAFTPGVASGTALPASAVTNAAGDASTSWTVGTSLGPEHLEATVAGLPPASFIATVRAGPLRAALSLESGAGQTGVVGLALPLPVVVRLTDLSGAPLVGRPITFLSDGGGSPSSAAVDTDADGRAAHPWVMGPSASPQRLEAHAIDPITGLDIPPVVLEVTPAAGPPAMATILAGDHATGPQRFPLPGPLRVRIADAFSNPIAGVPVDFVPVTGGGSTSPTSAVTSASGEATSTWKLGAAIGTQVLEARVGAGPAATFTATATAGDLFDGYYVGGYSTLCAPIDGGAQVDGAMSFVIRSSVLWSEQFGAPAEVGWVGSVDPVTGAASFWFQDLTSTLHSEGTFVVDGSGGATGSGTTSWYDCPGTWNVVRQ